MAKDILLAIGAIYIAIFAGCSTIKEAKQADHTKPMDRQIISSVNFVPGQRVLSPDAANEINKAIEAAKQKGEIESIEVVVWPDVKRSRSGEALPPKERELAEERGESVKAFIDRRQPDSTVNVANMAEDLSPLSKIVDTKNIVVERRLTSLGYTSGPYSSYKTGKPSTALVVIKLK